MLRTLRRWFPDLIIIGLVVMAGSMVFSRLWSDRQSAWETRVEAVSATARENLAHALEAEEVADSLRSQAARAASEASARSDETDELIVAIPPAVTPAEEQRDSVIVRLVGERDGWREAYLVADSAYNKLQGAFDLAIERGDSLQAVLDDRPGDRPWFIPRVTIGASGVLDDGAFEVKVPAINLGWEIKF
jgi:hypothetical protein